jgi:hypothetical protein
MTDNDHARDPAAHSPHCRCGVLLTPGARRCSRCRSRARYNWRRTHAPASPRNGRPGTGPANREAGK